MTQTQSFSFNSSDDVDDVITVSRYLKKKFLFLTIQLVRSSLNFSVYYNHHHQYPNNTTTTFLLFSLRHYHYQHPRPPPRFFCLLSVTTTTPQPPLHFYCFLFATKQPPSPTTFLLFSLHQYHHLHHHISIVFPPQALLHFYCFSSSSFVFLDRFKVHVGTMNCHLNECNTIVSKEYLIIYIFSHS